MKNIIKTKYPVIIFIIVSLFATVIFFLSFFVFKVDNTKIDYEYATDISNQWYVIENNEKRPLGSLTREEAGHPHDTMRIYCDFDDSACGKSALYILTKNEKIRIYLNDQKLDYEYGYENKIPFYEELGAVRNIIELKLNGEWIDLNGQTLSIELTPFNEKSEMSDGQYTILFGSKDSIIASLHKNDNGVIIVCLFCLIFSLMFIFLGINQIIIKQQNGKQLLYLGIFIIISVIWLASDSLLFQYLTPFKYVNYLLFNFSFLLLPIPITLFASELFPKYRKVYSIFSIIVSGYALLRIILYLTSALDFTSFLFIEHLLMFVIIAFSLYTSIKDFKNKSKRYLIVCYGTMIVLSAFSLIYFYLNRSLRVLRNGFSSYFFISIIVFGIIYLINLWIENKKINEQAIQAKFYKSQIYIDNLTKVGNRAALEKDLDDLANQEIKSIVVWMIDLNNLKEINDHYGHASGDELLINTCHNLKQVFQTEGKIYRIGGDELVVIMTDITQTEVLIKIATLDETIKHFNSNQKIPIDYAIGYAYEDNISSLNKKFLSLLRTADLNMYVDKNQKKNKIKSE